MDCLNDKVMFSMNKSKKDLLSLAQKDSIKKKGYVNMSCIVDYYKQYGLSKTISEIFMSDFSKICPSDLLDFSYHHHIVIQIALLHKGIVPRL